MANAFGMGLQWIQPRSAQEPGTGYVVELDGKSLAFTTWAHMEGALDDEVLIETVDAFDELLAGIECDDAGVEEIARPKPNVTILREGHAFRTAPTYAYKFVTEESYDKYYSSGEFQLGTLEYYRPLEMKGIAAGDRMEGRAYCELSLLNSDTCILGIVGGFDTYIASFSDSLVQRELMADRFGPVILRFDLSALTSRLKRMFGWNEPFAQVVEYSDLKIVRMKAPARFNPENLPPIHDRSAFEAFYRVVEPISLFVKPTRFNIEREIRLAFPSGKRVVTPLTVSFENHDELWTRV